MKFACPRTIFYFFKDMFIGFVPFFHRNKHVCLPHHQTYSDVSASFFQLYIESFSYNPCSMGHTISTSAAVYSKRLIFTWASDGTLIQGHNLNPFRSLKLNF
jgi:hypothetical protein